MTNTSSSELWFKHLLSNKPLVEQLKKITFVISDVDGALTNATVYVDGQGEGGRCFSTQDGFIVKYLTNAGIRLALMSGKDNPSTMQRACTLHIPQEMVIVGLTSKHEAVKQLQQKYSIRPEQTLMYGDDFLDASLKQDALVGLYACPNNTPFYLQQLANIHLPYDGGHNAFRLMMDALLFVQGKHFAQHLIEQVLI